MKFFVTLITIAFYLASASLVWAQAVATAAEYSFISTDAFKIPDTPPETTITATSMLLGSGVITLEGNVRAVREGDLLTCGLAFLGQDPKWLLASQTPRFYRKESVPKKGVTRETTIDARNILWRDTTGTMNASTAVTVKVEERSWDLATYSWLIISADEMEGFKQTNRLVFKNNVRIKDKDHFGTGNRLDYDKASASMILTGNAHVEGEKWSNKEKKMVKQILDGEIIRYNTNTKEMSSE